MHFLSLDTKKDMYIKVLGGKLRVSFKPNADGSYSDVWLTGPTERVFDGDIELPT